MENGATTRESTTNNINNINNNNNNDNYTAVKLPPTMPASSSSSNSQRPHRCEICQRSFREVATLKKHEQLHRADRPYVCQTCGKSFLWSSNLKVHERVHTGERPYKCKICHRCFTQSNDLRRHERNVHMRGKLYGYKNGALVAAAAAAAGRGAGGAAAPGSGGSHVNLAAYQAFAMQQRALLHQALSYETYLNSAAVTQTHHFPQTPNPPHMVTSKEGVGVGVGVCLPPRGGAVMKRTVEDAAAGVLRRDSSLHRSPVKLEQVTPPSTPGDGGAGGVMAMGEKRMMMGAQSQGPDPLQHSPGTLGHSPGTLGHSPGSVQHSPGNLRHSPANLQHSPISPRYLPSTTCHAPMSLPGPLGSPPMLLKVGHRPYPPNTPSHLHHHSHHHHHHRHASPLHVSPPAPQAATTTTTTTTNDNGNNNALPSFNGFQQASLNGSDYDLDRRRAPMSSPLPLALSRLSNGEAREGRCMEGSGGEEETDGKHPCDSVMDLSINKTPELRPSSGSGSGTGSDAEKRPDIDERDDSARSHPKTPSSESECEGKRDVTTTSSTPLADNGIHRCQHCNIFFYDYTMFHLHESLHMPYEDYPFRCPSCGKHCQDRIEFMFHTVWHVKYPHTIPNYEPFKDNFVS